MSDRAAWRGHLYLGTDHHGDFLFVAPLGDAPDIPARGRIVKVLERTLGPLPPTAAGAHGAAKYWQVRDQWRGWPDDRFAECYEKWQPRRDTILAKEEVGGRRRDAWQLFYLALADERQARAHALGELSLSFGLDAGALLSALAAAGKPFEPPAPRCPRPEGHPGSRPHTQE